MTDILLTSVRNFCVRTEDFSWVPHRVVWLSFEKDDTWEPITNLTGSEQMICEFQKQHELDFATKTAPVLKQVVDRRLKTTNEKKDFTSLEHYLTLAPKWCRSVITNTSPHPGKTRVTDFFQWSLKVFIWIILWEKWILWMNKSLNLAFWITNSVSWETLYQCGSRKEWLVGSSSGHHLDWCDVG